MVCVLRKRAAEEIANRTVCEDFEQFKPLFELVKKDLASGIRQTRRFQTMAEVKKGEFFIVGCQVAYIAELGEAFMTQYERRDVACASSTTTGPRATCYCARSSVRCGEAGRRITDPTAGPLFADETDDGDLASGTIYVFSKSDHPVVAAHRDVLHKIGVTGGDVERGASSTPCSTRLF